MAGRNCMQLRHGTNAPNNGDLMPYELGITLENRLYVGTTQEDEEGKKIPKEIGYVPIDQIGNLNLWEVHLGPPEVGTYFAGYVTSLNIADYPSNGQQDNKWYVYKGMIGKLLTS